MSKDTVTKFVMNCLLMYSTTNVWVIVCHKPFWVGHPGLHECLLNRHDLFYGVCVCLCVWMWMYFWDDILLCSPGCLWIHYLLPKLNNQSARITGKLHGTGFVVLTDYEVQLSPLGCFNIMFHLFVCLTGRLLSAYMWGSRILDRHLEVTGFNPCVLAG